MSLLGGESGVKKQVCLALPHAWLNTLNKHVLSK